jgi:hypothetical protein
LDENLTAFYFWVNDWYRTGRSERSSDASEGRTRARQRAMSVIDQWTVASALLTRK